MKEIIKTQDLRRVMIYDSGEGDNALDQHNYPHNTHKYRRAICPRCRSQWDVPIHANYTRCENCQGRGQEFECWQMIMYEVDFFERVRSEDEELRAGDLCRRQVAFHTGRWSEGMGMGFDYGTDVPEGWEPPVNPGRHPVYGWDYDTGEEYGRP